MTAPELFGTWGGLGEHARRLLLAAAAGDAECGRCEQRKPLTAFAFDGHGERMSTCLECRNEAQRELRATARDTGRSGRETEGAPR
jgi:hypothetical protein